MFQLRAGIPWRSLEREKQQVQVKVRNTGEKLRDVIIGGDNSKSFIAKGTSMLDWEKDK